MKKGLTELVFILDKSGSMSGLETDTIGGYNSMLEKQKAVDGECIITTVLFDNTYVLLHDRIDIRAVSPITENEYRVGGSTDGMENASREYSPETIRNLIDMEKIKYGWEFIFLGANIDAVQTAGRYGIGADRAVDYLADREGTNLNFRVMSSMVTEYRQKSKISDEHLDEIRKDVRKRGAQK